MFYCQSLHSLHDAITETSIKASSCSSLMFSGEIKIFSVEFESFLAYLFNGVNSHASRLRKFEVWEPLITLKSQNPQILGFFHICRPRSTHSFLFRRLVFHDLKAEFLRSQKMKDLLTLHRWSSMRSNGVSDLQKILTAWRESCETNVLKSKLSERCFPSSTYCFICMSIIGWLSAVWKDSKLSISPIIYLLESRNFALATIDQLISNIIHSLMRSILHFCHIPFCLVKSINLQVEESE